MDVDQPLNLGALERKPDNRDILLGAVQAPVNIPASYIPDMSWLKRNYQGQTPTCGAHAAAHFQAILEHALDPTTAPRYSPRFSWIKIKAIDGFPLSAGTDMRSIFKSLTTDGADDFEPLENNVLLPLATYSDRSVITPNITANASTKKIDSYGFDALTFDALCQAIYQSKAVLLLIKCDNGFWGTSTPTFTTPTYGHFICAYGFDENYLYIVDSADPNDAFAFKRIAKQYVTPNFFFESGTAVDIPREQIQAIIQAAQTILPQVVTAPIPTQEKIDFFAAILSFFQSLFPKVGSASQPMSKSFSISSPEFISVLKGLGIALAGAALTYLTSYISGTDFGAYTPVVVALWSVVVNFARKYVPDTTPTA